MLVRMKTTRTIMQTKERPPTDHSSTYTQTEAAKLCGVTQRSLVDRPGRKGYLTKLHQCFPGKHFSKVATGPIENQTAIKLTSIGVTELRDLIQALSPEPPALVDGRPTYHADGKVIKVKRSPTHTLSEYAEFIWFKEGFDGSTELQEIAKNNSTPNAETIEAACVEAEAVSAGQLVTVDHTSEPVELAWEQIEEMDSNFWQEAERRASRGYQQGRFLKSIELKAMTQGESDLSREYYERSKKVASRKRTG